MADAKEFDREKIEKSIESAVRRWLAEQRPGWEKAGTKPGKRFISDQETGLFLLLLRDLQPAALLSANQDLQRLSRQIGSSKMETLRVKIEADALSRARSLSRRTAIQIVGNTADRMRVSAELIKNGGKPWQDRLDTLFGQSRAQGVSITATTGGKSAGTTAVANILNASGLQTEEIWEIEDSSACPICKPLDGKTRKVWGRKFPRGTPAHKNCRCNIRLRIIP